MFSVLSRIFNKSNFKKILILFIVGFVSRVLVGYLYNINVYLYFLCPISNMYYIYMSTFMVLAYEFVNTFYFNIIPSFRFLIIKESIKVFYSNGLNNKLFMDSNANEIKPYGKTGLGDKSSSSHRPMKSSPLSNTPITPTNINEMKPTREIRYSGKTNSSLRPVNFNHLATSQEASAQDLAFQERNKKILRYKDEFKEFYTTYRESIKLSDYELESLSIKMAIENEKGNSGWQILPEDIQPLYKKYLRKFLIQKIKPIY